MNQIQYPLLLLLFCTVLSCSPTEKDNNPKPAPAQTENNPTVVKPITIPPIEMKSISLTGEKNATPPIKNELGIPGRNETKRIPRDFVIGELGQGTIPIEVYGSVKDFCQRIIASTFTVQDIQFLPAQEQEQILEIIRFVNPVQYRIGGGRMEADGRYSFLIRLLGPAESASGEVYTHFMNSSWVIDDFSLEMDEKGTFDPFQYKHFL